VWSTLLWEALVAREPNLAALIPLLVLPAAAVLLGGLWLLLASLLAAPPRFYRWVLGSALPLLSLALLGIGKLGLVSLIVTTVVVASVTGAGLAVTVKKGGLPDATRLQRGVTLAGLGLGTAAILFSIAWLLWPGPGDKPLPDAARVAGATPPAPPDLPDPSRPGSYRVKTLAYGSGTDRHRPEFGAKADLRTKPVDGSALIGRWSGLVGWARTRYWGFDDTKLPLQGRVWCPEGDGPFPLVLVVHGNHLAEDFSDPGYAYLGELMASRGFILVSVDENFLNSTFSDLLGLPDIGLEEENDARGWLLLEHLKAWRDWSRTDGNPFRGKVDLDRIALIGHSRGGEAVAVAAAFNPLPFYPDDGRVPFDYRFRIRGVVAIAPVDGQYKPAGTGTRPENVNYFVLHGSHDGDVESFHGSRVFERVRFTDGGDHFKAGLYVHRANHGQFNTSWGRGDSGGLGDAFLNLRTLLPEEDQERIARVYISAFLEATLHDRHGYRALFRDRRVGASWLPDVVCLQQYQDSATRFVSGYEEDIDLTTTTLPGGKTEGTSLTDWREKEIKIKWGSLETRAAVLGWDAGRSKTTATYAITLPAAGLALRPDSVLTFHLADAKQDPSKPLGQKEAPKPEPAKEKADEQKEPIDLTLEVADRAGHVARLPLSHVAALQPQIESKVAKAGFLSDAPTSEVVFQAFDFLLASFAAANPAFDPVSLASVRLVFDRTPKGVVILDDVGIR